MRLAARRGQVVWTQRFKAWPDNDAVSNFVYEQLFCFVLFYFICLLICFILNTCLFFLLLICKLLFISPGWCTSCFACWLLKLLLSNLLQDHKLPCSNVSYFLWAAHMKWMLNHTIKNPKHWSLNRSRTLRAWHNTTAQPWNSRWSSFSHVVLNIEHIWHTY